MPLNIAAVDLESLDSQAQRLLAAFTCAGYERVAPAVVQPAELFLDVVGEDLRARTYVFTDLNGAELCLRPDLTLPTCRLHLERHADANTSARYCYGGSAFRFQPAGDSKQPREFRQVGIESFASSDREADDATVLGTIVDALSAAGVSEPKLRLGDLGLFTALLDALPMPERWRRRLEHKLWRPEAFRAELRQLARGAARPVALPSSLFDRLDPGDSAGAKALVLEHLDATGSELQGTRTAVEIANRLLAEAADRREKPLSPASAAMIETYVAAKAPARAVADMLTRLGREHGIDLSAGLDAFQRRLKLIAQAGVAIADAEFCAGFGRNLGYYTGLVFEITAPTLGPNNPIAGGGRYDGLLAAVGATTEVPAVGGCVHVERLLAVLKGGDQ